MYCPNNPSSHQLDANSHVYSQQRPCMGWLNNCLAYTCQTTFIISINSTSSTHLLPTLSCSTHKLPAQHLILAQDLALSQSHSLALPQSQSCIASAQPIIVTVYVLTLPQPTYVCLTQALRHHHISGYEVMPAHDSFVFTRAWCPCCSSHCP